MKGKMRYIFALAAVVIATLIFATCGTDSQQPHELSAADIKAEVLGRARLVTVSVFLERPIAEIIAGLSIEVKMNISRAEEAMNLTIEALGAEATQEQREAAASAALELYQQNNIITVENILEDRNLREEAIGLLPTGSEVFENGMVRLHVPPSALGFSFPIMPRNIGMLSEDSVVIPLTTYFSICNSISADGADSFLVEFTLLANSELEDVWKKEVLFDGTVRDLCVGESEYSPRIDENRSIAIFKRPASKVFQLPSEKPIIVGSVKNLGPGDTLYFAHYALDSGNLKLAVGLFEDVAENNNGDDIIRFSGEFQPLTDGGTPIYHISKKNKLELVAFSGMSGPIGIEAEFIFEGLGGIPHVLGESILNEQIQVE